MKCIFLCGSLEPGRDGVGDYVRCLSIELIKEGHTISVIALNDQYVQSTFFGNQAFGHENLTILRLPSSWKSSERLAHAAKWIEEFGADWLSLQFVPFAFHSKGLPFALGKQLAILGKGRSWHIMFHELWVGMEYESSAKHMWWGLIQKYLIRHLIAHIQPKIIHTQTRLYQAQLAKLGFASHYLPLFSNIPNLSIRKNDSHIIENFISSNKNINLVAFGTIHPDAPIETFAYEASQYATQHALSITLIMIGRCGKEQERWAAEWKAVGLPVKILGEQAVEYISETLSNASLGVTTTPEPLVGKSGTVAAMQAHDLPVICVTRPWHPRHVDNVESLKGVYTYTKGKLSQYINEPLHSSVSNKVSEVAQQLSKALLTGS